MSVRERGAPVAVAAVAVAAVVGHLLAGTGVVLTASQWLGGAAIAVLITFVVILHAVGLRRLAARRGRAPVARREEE